MNTFMNHFENIFKISNHEWGFRLYKYGIKRRIFYPNFHGRRNDYEKYFALDEFSKKDKITKLAFYHNITCVSQYIKKNKINFQSAFDLLNETEISNHPKIIRSKLKLFEEN